MKPIPYRNKKLRFTVALIAGTYMLLHGRPFNILIALKSVGFYIIWFISVGLAVAIVEIIHRSIVWLDSRFPWREKKSERFFAQFFICWLTPGLIDLILMSFYFEAKKQDIFENGFFWIDFPFILILLAILNFYYYGQYHSLSKEALDLEAKTEPEDKKIRTEPTENDLLDDLLFITYRNKKICLNVSNDILYFYRKDKQVRICTVNYADYPIPGTLNELSKRYAHLGFCQINRSIIISYRIAQSYQDGERRNTKQLTLRSKYISKDIALTYDQLTVTKEHISTFLRGWDKFHK